MAQAAVSLKENHPRSVVCPDSTASRPGRWCRSGTAEVEQECLAIIRAHSELPPAARGARPRRIEVRTMTRRLLRQLIAQAPPPNSPPGWSTRILNREESLAAHIGSTLYCVLIRLPGVHYTLEIDPEAQQVVHWEWQPA